MPSSNYRCKRCETNYLAEIHRMSGGNKNVYVDMSRVVSRCKIPKFSHSQFGHPIVTFWDCEKKIEIRYTQKEYERLRASGEL